MIFFFLICLLVLHYWTNADKRYIASYLYSNLSLMYRINNTEYNHLESSCPSGDAVLERGKKKLNIVHMYWLIYLLHSCTDNVNKTCFKMIFFFLKCTPTTTTTTNSIHNTIYFLKNKIVKKLYIGACNLE